jgi:hypothetical protein
MGEGEGGVKEKQDDGLGEGGCKEKGKGGLEAVEEEKEEKRVEESFQALLRNRYEGHRMRTNATTQFQRYVREKKVRSSILPTSLDTRCPNAPCSIGKTLFLTRSNQIH